MNTLDRTLEIFGAREPDEAMVAEAQRKLDALVAGRVASQLAADGYSCKLGTPSVSRDAHIATQNQNGVAHERTDLICEGHRLSLEIQCCYADP